MRVNFLSLDRVKKAAQKAAAVAGCSLSSAQGAIALATGYRDFHDLTNCVGSSSIAGDIGDYEKDRVTLNLEVGRRLADALSIGSADALYIVGASRLLSVPLLLPEEQLITLTRLWSIRELPNKGRRFKGAIGRIGRSGEAILRKYGKPTTVITHKSADTTIADFEYVSPRTGNGLFVPMRLYAPYGVWTERDGSEVVFSRDYCPLWRLRSGRRPERIAPWQRITFEKQDWFWDDSNAPWRSTATFRTQLNKLATWRVPFLPKLVDVLPLLVERDELRDFRDGVHALKEIAEAVSEAAA